MLWLFSGLGADHRLYRHLQLPEQHQHAAWTDFRDCRTMASFVARARELGLSDGDLICGSSFGGMLALECSQTIDLAGILLLGSAMHPREINQFALRGGHFLRAMSGADAQRLVRPFIHIGPRQLAAEMFVDGDERAMRSMFQAILTWKGAQPRCPWRRVHGRFDPVIPMRPGQRYHRVVNAAHLVALSEPGVCQQELERLLGLAR